MFTSWNLKDQSTKCENLKGYNNKTKHHHSVCFHASKTQLHPCEGSELMWKIVAKTSSQPWEVQDPTYYGG
jgi:hypothetical protein